MLRRLTPLTLAVVLLCLVAPAVMAKRTVPQNFFGAVFDGPSAVSAPEQQDKHMSLMAQTGVESVRVTFPGRRSNRAARNSTSIARIAP